jgi:DNA-binding MarR family transcriptional regulator
MRVARNDSRVHSVTFTSDPVLPVPETGGRDEAAAVPSLEVAAAVADSCVQLVRGFARVKAQLLAQSRDDVDWSAHLLLTRLASIGAVRSSELAEVMQSDPSTVSRQVATLVKDGYVERRADPIDGRASLLVVTERGEQVYAEHQRQRNEHYQRMLADWTEDECRAFAAMTARFTEGITAAQPAWYARPAANRSGARSVPAASTA